MTKDPILFFDGVCNLCNSTVDFLIERDVHHVIKYSSLQGKTASELLTEKYTQDLNTVVLYQDGKIYTKSEAVIRALMHLGPKYAITRIFLIIPGFIRNFFYNLIAKNRYRIWGQKDTCRLPTESEKKLFLD